ncbi:MAG: nucleotidyltransferase family protein [Terracidiphilus sp.]
MRVQSDLASYQSMTLLSLLLLVSPEQAGGSWIGENLHCDLGLLGRHGFDDLLRLAALNHVVMRGMGFFLAIARGMRDDLRAQCAIQALAVEQRRIANALPFLAEIAESFENAGYGCSVIKTLDHWPDLGSDIDLFSSASPAQVVELMTRRFGASVAPRSWGDRLACKWNFQIAGLPELIEIHVGRLGQTGEQISIASSLLRRTRLVTVAGRSFRVPSNSDRVLLSALQRMYRHFYFRLCDIVDTAALVENDEIDFTDLHDAAEKAGIWEGVATYLAIVSDYTARYRGVGLNLPEVVAASARFGGDAVYFARGFLRVPILPQSARLYGAQLALSLRKRQLQTGARLSLLPWLATAAAVGHKVTGSDKGIW